LLTLGKSRRVEAAIGRCLGGLVANPKVNVIPFYIEVEESSSHRLVIEHALHPVCAFVVGKPTDPRPVHTNSPTHLKRGGFRRVAEVHQARQGVAGQRP
jgi:hypothetical protein